MNDDYMSNKLIEILNVISKSQQYYKDYHDLDVLLTDLFQIRDMVADSILATRTCRTAVYRSKAA